jgi:excisionase family DNA binding protein
MPLQKRFKNPPASAQSAETAVGGGPRLLNLKKSAEYLSAHPWAVRQMVKNSRIPHIRLGRAYLIDRQDLDRFITKNKVGVI